MFASLRTTAIDGYTYQQDLLFHVLGIPVSVHELVETEVAGLLLNVAPGFDVRQWEFVLKPRLLQVNQVLPIRIRSCMGLRYGSAFFLDFSFF